MCETQTLNMIKEVIKPKIQVQKGRSPPHDLFEIKSKKKKNPFGQHKTLTCGFLAKYTIKMATQGQSSFENMLMANLSFVLSLSCFL